MKSLKHYSGNGIVTIENNLLRGLRQGCSIGIQIEEDGRVWVCLDGISAIRFRPYMPNEREQYVNKLHGIIPEESDD